MSRPIVGAVRADGGIAAGSTVLPPVARRLLDVTERVVPRWAVLLLTVPALAGCLVTDARDYGPEPNEPPFIVYPSNGTLPPLNSLIEVDLDDLVEGTTTELSFSVEIDDVNEDQRLYGRRFINRSTVGTSPFTDLRLEPTGERRRTLRFAVSLREFLESRCNRLELFVSSGFATGTEPLEAGDLAAAAWSVLLYRGVQSVELPLECGVFR